MGVIFIPLMAMVADKIGSLKLMSYASLALTILIYPIFYIMNSGVYMLIILGVAMMVLLICSFQAPIFASTVRAVKEHGYRASFTAVILGSAAGIIGGLTPAIMTSLQEIIKDPFAPAYLIATASLISFFVIKRKLSLEINQN
jgi:MHS family proline/betaine transporter-like MFS transporter